VIALSPLPDLPLADEEREGESQPQEPERPKQKLRSFPDRGDTRSRPTNVLRIGGGCLPLSAFMFFRPGGKGPKTLGPTNGMQLFDGSKDSRFPLPSQTCSGGEQRDDPRFAAKSREIDCPPDVGL